MGQEWEEKIQQLEKCHFDILARPNLKTKKMYPAEHIHRVDSQTSRKTQKIFSKYRFEFLSFPKSHL